MAPQAIMARPLGGGTSPQQQDQSALSAGRLGIQKQKLGLERESLGVSREQGSRRLGIQEQQAGIQAAQGQEQTRVAEARRVLEEKRLDATLTAAVVNRKYQQAMRVLAERGAAFKAEAQKKESDVAERGIKLREEMQEVRTKPLAAIEVKQAELKRESFHLINKATKAAQATQLLDTLTLISLVGEKGSKWRGPEGKTGLYPEREQMRKQRINTRMVEATARFTRERLVFAKSYGLMQSQYYGENSNIQRSATLNIARMEADTRFPDIDPAAILGEAKTSVALIGAIKNRLAADTWAEIQEKHPFELGDSAESWLRFVDIFLEDKRSAHVQDKLAALKGDKTQEARVDAMYEEEASRAEHEVADKRELYVSSRDAVAERTLINMMMRMNDDSTNPNFRLMLDATIQYSRYPDRPDGYAFLTSGKISKHEKAMFLASLETYAARFQNDKRGSGNLAGRMFMDIMAATNPQFGDKKRGNTWAKAYQTLDSKTEVVDIANEYVTTMVAANMGRIDRNRVLAEVDVPMRELRAWVAEDPQRVYTAEFRKRLAVLQAAERRLLKDAKIKTREDQEPS